MPVRLTLAVPELVLASWKTDSESVARAVYPGLEPATVDGDHLVSLAALRVAGGRLGSVPLPPFSQLNVRTYVMFEGEAAVYFLRSYVSLAGLGGALFGAPLRAARIRLRPGRVETPGAGVSLAYELAGPGAPGELGAHELALYEAAGLRSFRVLRGPAEWRRGEAAPDARADVLLSHGFEVSGDPRVFYGRGASFELDVPARKVAVPRKRGDSVDRHERVLP